MSKVVLKNSMGDDLAVVNAARVSMAKESKWEWAARGDESDLRCHIQLPESDKKLIGYLAKHEHWTPFSHVMLTFVIQMPIFVARQWFRHTVGFTRNETSRRYVDDAPEFFMPKYFRTRAANVKQGSTDEVHKDSGPWMVEARTIHAHALILYNSMIADGVPPEQARMFLPQTMETEFYETASLAAYARLCRQRQDAHAQAEIREFADKVAMGCQHVAPVSWAALMGGEG
ncbi:FAD-dependent thymidylate synthase [Acidithiobacillus albertensis]|uniref:FAD-dependent thymidylate synthase n=1 Tax=Acidithiobacillus albertensis TaxID=119978 RepID=UPI00094AAAC0|nr:FAD-dependent thymidylate synthase [Acidithiobacillus albertensis]